LELSAMEFRILGPVEVWEDGHPVSLGGGKQRAVLALLVLNANRIVSSDGLIDQLWNGQPPPTAGTALQGHISSLRKALGADVIATRRPGYVLEADPAQIDLARFEQLRGEARRALERGDAGAGADKLREALGLWRGEALADIGFEPSIQAEAARLEDLRLAALEDRIDAELAVGRSADLVDELERLVAANPLREHLWGQLMLALYRSGRQADALDAYRRARKTLVSELGLEPGPALRELERQVLAQDAALDPEPQPVARARRPAQRGGLLLLAAAAAVVVGLAALTLVLAGNGSDSRAIPGNAVVPIDPGENAVVKAIRLNPTPGPVAAGAGGVWVLSRGSSTISRIDPKTRRATRNFGLGKTPDNVAAAGEVWVSGGCSEGGNPGTLLHPFTGAQGGIELDEEIPLERAFPGEAPRLAPLEAGTRCGLAAAGRSVWVATNLPQGIVRVDYDRVAAQSRIVRSVALPRAPLAMAVGFGSVWATDNELNLIRRIDPDTGRTTRRIQVGNDPVAIAAGAGAVWVANRGDGSLSRINPATSSVTKAISVGDTPVAVAVGEGSVWVADSSDDAVDRIDPATNRLVESIAVEHQPQGLAVAGGLIWVTLRGG
jgi:YVTN family beta-propeller protein